MARKATVERIPKYICPLCGTTGLKSKRGVKKHCDIAHKGYEDFEAIWKASEKEFEARVPAKAGSQQEASQTPSEPNTRNSKPDVARKMVNFSVDQSIGRKPVTKVNSQVTKLDKSVTSSSTLVAETKPKAQTHLKPVPTPPPNAPEPLTGVLAIPKGSQLMIDGDIYYQDDNGFQPVRVERVAMTVGLRQAEPDGRTWLFCKVDDVIYGLDERLVLSGGQQLISLPPPVAVPDGPPATLCEVEEPVANIEYREKLPAFMDAVEAYYAIKQQAADVEKLLKAAREDHYDDIYNFTMAHGTESAKDKLDYVLCEAGYRAWLFRTPGRTRTDYNEPAIIQWCIDNGQEAVLCRALDKNAWEKLVESGAVPQSVGDLYTTKTDVPDTFRLSLAKEDV